MTGVGLQVWLPALPATPYRSEVQRDIQRAYAEWRGEGRVFLIPNFAKPRRWREGPGRVGRVLAVPSEHLNRVDVYQVGVNGYVWGRAAHARFPKARLDGGLLEAWLNVISKGSVQVFPAPEALTLAIPILGRRGVSYETVKVPLGPEPIVPVIKSDETSRKTITSWPPPGDAVPRPSVSPEEESIRVFGSRDSLARTFLPRADAPTLVHVGFVSWPEPLQALFPAGSGVDDLYAQAQMTDVVKQSRDDPDRARQAARDKAAAYLSTGWTTHDLSWLVPTYLAGREVGEPVAAVVHDASRFGIDVETLDELYRSPKWKKLRAERLPATRAWGAVGLFWALLMEVLETRRSFNSCERCGRIFEGKRYKRFCGPNDDKVCFNKRRAHDKRKSRSSGR